MDSVYFNKYFSILYNSIRKYVPEFHIVAKLINPSLDDYHKVESNFDIENVTFIYDKVLFKSIKPYLISARFLLAADVLASTNANVIVCDVDAIFKADSKSFFDDLLEPISLKFSHGFYPWRCYGAGFVYVHNNKLTKEMFSLFRRFFWERYDYNVNPRGNRQWWIDQCILYCLLEYYTKNFGLVVNNLSKKDLPLSYPSSLGISKDEFVVNYS